MARAALVSVVKTFPVMPRGEAVPTMVHASIRTMDEHFNDLPDVVQTFLKASAVGRGLRLILGACGGLQNKAQHQLAPLPDSARKLNKSQLSAVEMGLANHISLVRGPPGTGKTSTVAAYAGAVVAGGGRILILAPANSATLRVLESVVAQNLCSVALVACKEWMLEWHQDAVHAHLQPFVVTPEILDVKKQKERKRSGEYAHASTGSGDLNDRAVTKPQSKWDHIE